MKARDVQLGHTYAVKVSGAVVPVRLHRAHPFGGWEGHNVKTGRTVRVKTAARLRYEVLEPAPTT